MTFLIVFLVAFWLMTSLRALSANRVLDLYIDDVLRNEPVGAAVHAYQHGFAGRDPAGNLKAFVPGDTLVGLFESEVNNSAGAAAALNANVITAGDYRHAVASVALTDVGRPVFATADGTLALTGHPEAFAGTIVGFPASGIASIRLPRPGERPPNARGSITLALTGHEAFTATGATAGTAIIEAFDFKTILGPGALMQAIEDAGLQLAFDATAEIALASIRTRGACLPIDKGLTLEVDLVVSDIADSSTVDLDFGFGTALSANSEADIDHADMAQLFAFHVDGASDNILLQSDNATTDVAAVDTTIDNDSTTDVTKKFKMIVRPDGTCEGWINGVRALTTTAFAMLSTALVSVFVNLEKTSNDTTCEVIFRNLLVKAGMAA